MIGDGYRIDTGCRVVARLMQGGGGGGAERKFGKGRWRQGGDSYTPNRAILITNLNYNHVSPHFLMGRIFITWKNSQRTQKKETENKEEITIPHLATICCTCLRNVILFL